MENRPTQSVCPSCSVEIRDGAMFCYNCGTATPAADETEFLEAAVAEADTEAKVIEEKQAETKDPWSVSAPIESRPIATPKKRREKRRHSKPQAVEIVPRSGPQWQFVIATAVLFVIGFVVILLALYFK
ncbi:MAG: zinc ribbon domain-containing protein [Acidobacteria bacterium]|nr:zinc ribbon domain-containing protein [Acidobacteriota bacterium]